MSARSFSVSAGRRHLDAGQVDALVVLEDAADDDRGDHLVAAHAPSPRARGSRRRAGSASPGFTSPRQAGVGRRHAALVAAHRRVGGDDELAPRRPARRCRWRSGRRGSSGPAGRAAPRPRGPRLSRLAAHRLQRLGVVVALAVREVEPRDVHARVDQLADLLGPGRRGTEGADDLGAAHRIAFSTGDCRATPSHQIVIAKPLLRSGSPA